jgi:hypothetical protein
MTGYSATSTTIGWHACDKATRRVERMAGEGDGHAKAVSGHEYIVLLFIVTTL